MEATATIVADRRRGDRRQGRFSFRLRERRSGFDRRVDPSAGPLRRRYITAIRLLAGSGWAMGALVGMLLAVNLADLLLTAAALEEGATELNPVMASLFDAGAGVAAAFKIGVVGVVAAAAWMLRRHRRVVEATLAAVALLSAVVGYQVVAGMVV